MKDERFGWEKILADIREAIATGREPEDVQAERHERERREAEEGRLRLRDYVTYYGNPRVFLPLLTGTEWDENWRSWPHCNGQAGCWMHYSPESRWCRCRCVWCRIARRTRSMESPL